MTPLSMGTARETQCMNTMKVGDLLDLSSPREPSICPGGGRLQSTATVHHRPEGYQHTEEHRQGNRWPTNHIEAAAATVAPSSYVKMETGNGKCPNILVRNGVICTPYREEIKEEEIGIGSMREKRTENTSK